MYETNWNNNNMWFGQQMNPNQFNRNYQPLPHYEIVKVNGEAGAKSFQMAENSSIFLADATNPNIIWMVQTDGARYSTATPLDVKIHQDAPPPNYNDLEERVKRLEDMYGQFNSGSNKQTKKQQQRQPVEQSTDTTT